MRTARRSPGWPPWTPPRTCTRRADRRWRFCRPNAAVLTAFCSSPVNLARLSVKVSATRNCIPTADSRNRDPAASNRTLLVIIPPRNNDVTRGPCRQIADDAGLDVNTRLPGQPTSPSSHPEHLHHLVAEVVDDLDGDAARLRAVERCWRARGPEGNSTSVDRKMLGSPAASSSQQRARVLTGVKARRFAPPPLRGADGLDAGSAHARPDWLLLTMPTPTPPTCCGRRPVQDDTLSSDR